MAKQGLKAYADRVASAGRHGDTELAHLSPDEIDILHSLQGHVSINPETGLPEFFSLKKILKGVAKAAGALAGGYFGGPAGAAVGAGAVSALMGDSASKSLTAGLLAGLGSWGAQQTGIGDMVGGGFSSGADLLGQQAADAGIQTASAVADSGGGGGGGGLGLSAALPLLGLGAAALGGGAGKSSKADSGPAPEEIESVDYQPMNRTQTASGADPYTYGMFGPEFQYFDEVNPALQPMRDGGRVHFRYGGESVGDREGTGHQAAGDRGGNTGGRQEGRGGGGQDVVGGRAVTGRGIADRGGISDRERAAREQYSHTMMQGNQANLAGPHGYNSAVDRYHKEHPANELDRWDVLDFIGGPFIDANPPDVTKPASYAGGDWHTSTNVGGALGTVGGAALGFPGLGLAGSWIDDQLGIPDVYHGGPGYVSDAAREYQAGLNGGNNASAPQGGGTGQGNFGQTPIKSILQAATVGAGAAGGNPPAGTPTPETPALPAGRTYEPLTNPYTYGQFGPEHQFFTGSLADVDMARGGTVPGGASGGGQDDIIPAALAPNEHVLDAEIVSAIGDGNSDAGHAKIEQFKQAIRKHKRSAKPGSIPPMAKSIGEYMTGRAA
jgi:hypothetical protein